MRDLFNNIHVVPAINPAAATADNTAWVSPWIDTRGYEGLTFLLAIGALADADATFAVTMDHANLANQSDAAAVTATDVLGTLGLAGFRFDDDNETRKIGYVGNRRYVRLTVTPSNNTGNAFLAAVALLGFPNIAPTPNPPV